MEQLNIRKITNGYLCNYIIWDSEIGRVSYEKFCKDLKGVRILLEQFNE